MRWMKYIALAVLALFLSALVATAQPRPPMPPADAPLSLPKEVKFTVGDPIVLKPATAAKRVAWKVPAAVKTIAHENGLTLYCWAKPGSYCLRATVIVGTTVDTAEIVEAECVLVVDGGSTPPPPPPPVEDPFRKELLALIAAEPVSPDKAGACRQLAALYRQAAKLAGDQSLVTAGELVERVRAAASTLLLPSALTAARRRVAEELGRSMPGDPDAPLTPELRAMAADIYTRAGLALDEATR